MKTERGRRSLSATFANLAMRQVVLFPGGKLRDGKGFKSGLGVRLPAGWAEELGLDQGSVVMLSKHGKEIRVYPVDEKQLLESLKATIGDP